MNLASIWADSQRGTVVSRIPPRRPRTLRVRLIQWYCRRAYGKDIALFDYLAHVPPYPRAYAAMRQFLQLPGEVGPEMRAFVVQLISINNGCAWCQDFGRFLAPRRRVDLAKFDAVAAFATDDRFSVEERAALAIAEASTKEGLPFSDEMIAEAHRYFTNRQIVEIITAAAAINFDNRINAALGIQQQGFCVPHGDSAELG